MADVLKFVGGLFGIGGNDTAEESAKTAYVDPEASRQALAELAKEGLIDDDQSPQPQRAAQSATHAVDQSGNIDFDLLFSQAGVESGPMTADQAIKLIVNVEKTIPATMTEVERNQLLRNVVLATVSTPISSRQLVRDARKRSAVLDDLIRARLDIAANFKQQGADRIKHLEAQIAAAKAAIDAADRQFSVVSDTCKKRQAQYARLAKLFSDTDAKAPAVEVDEHT